MIIKINNLSKTFNDGKKKKTILENLNLSIKTGQSIAITGRSGCGKTTLLNIIGGLLDFDYGDLFINNININSLSLNQIADYRKNYFGFITQNFNLLDDRNVFENVALPLYYSSIKKSDIQKRVNTILTTLDISHLAQKNIKNLSGGEKQRVAIARALVKKSKIILADEPTGSLDEKTELDILNIFSKLKNSGITLIIVTHNKKVANHCDLIYELKNKSLISIPK
ncbi:MAG: ABC transporter ATP-binding protein [Sarcina ventriculi]|uniref:Macrolide export ATP-binding/permease protein MacB n=1 Tax=Sarcina ventriculi TaxID=1267 RepID=A0ABP2ASL0_SARVE|nr:MULTISPECIES: ABC transporter ATP-binding protein [Sarcina]MCI5636976.1 ABC transporter ATP-binding protein [Sarcina ventriculi]MDD7372199.1 ABC transporter ATP-binding protein [Sarcina ventriculi]MDY7062477.1 ABC transporter ATP-binding protein [Sarcina ventriculi]CUO25342.1 Macrolide export ATP-binding/permease protein MacB [Sarcina ventriculi]